MILLLALLACGRGSDPFAPLPKDAAKALAACDDERFPELATTCRVEAAARAAQQEQPDVAEQACAAIPEGTWRDECHFRAGEEFGHQGELEPALSHCTRAGQYGKFCLTHLGWRAPADATLDPADPDAVLAAWNAERAEATKLLADVQPNFRQDAMDLLGARFWFNLYFGTGKTNPAAAKAAANLDGSGQAGPGDAGPAARQGFALETVRLLCPSSKCPGDVVDEVKAVWDGTKPPPTGDPLPPEQRFGRYHPPMSTLAEKDLATLPLYGGNRRLVAPDPADDLRVATLEAIYFLPDSTADVFQKYVDDPSPAVRWTAVRLIRVTPSPSMDHVAVLTDLAKSDDPGVRAEAEEGLRHREWEKFTGGPRPGEKPPGPGRPPGPPADGPGSDKAHQDGPSGHYP